MPALISIFLIVVLTVPSPVSAQKLPPVQSQKEGTPSQGAVAQASLPSTDEDIDKAVARIESRLVDLRKDLATSTETKGKEMVGLLTVPPEELRKRQRLLSELVVTLNRHAQSLREL